MTVRFVQSKLEKVIGKSGAEVYGWLSRMARTLAAFLEMGGPVAELTGHSLNSKLEGYFFAFDGHEHIMKEHERVHVEVFVSNMLTHTSHPIKRN